MDQNLTKHCTEIRGKKLWWLLFTWFVDASIHNAWILTENTVNAKTQFEFRHQISQHYL